MQLDSDTCYRAMVSRDRRFEGQFFVAVRSTGIYCRPGCPAPVPLKRNVVFFERAAAAEEAGFRPCLRCRPDSVPGTPAWLGTSATVARALKLIEGGGPDEVAAGALAARLGIGERHLRRLFAEHVGVSPGAVARTRRLHFARKLIDETALPMAEVALCSGFASVRRFNEAMLDNFRRSPTELRRRAKSVAPGPMRLKLPYRAPYDWEALLSFLRARAIPGVERVDENSWRRTVSVDGWSGVIAVEPIAGENALALSLSIPPGRTLIQIVERVTKMFDLDADPRAIGKQLEKDSLLKKSVAARPGLRVPGVWCGFEHAVRAILGQQVTVAHATALAGKIAAKFGAPLDGESGLTHLFPPAVTLASADVASVGMPGARGRAIRALAEAVASGAIDFSGAQSREETLAALVALPGVGPWTAEYVAMRALREPDAFPASDLGVRRALTKNGRVPPVPEIERRAARWRPWRAYAAMHLWEMQS